MKSPYIGPSLGSIATRLSLYVRKGIFKKILQVYPVNAEVRILDVGVTSDRRIDSNFFEKLYPYPQSITAVGTEDASFLEDEYPGLKFVRANGTFLPFDDNSFDLVVSFAVIEHVGDRDNQKKFMHELCRVGKSCFVTTPNRWFPVEFHTGLPILHWLPPMVFRKILNTIGLKFWAKEENLNLLTQDQLIECVPQSSTTEVINFRLLGVISNLFFYIH